MSCGTAIRSPQGVMRSIPNCFRRLHLSVEAYGRSRPYGSSLPSQYNASCAGRESRALACKHKPLSDFTVAVEQDLPMAHWRQVIEIAGANIFSKGVIEKGCLGWAAQGSRDARVRRAARLSNRAV